MIDYTEVDSTIEELYDEGAAAVDEQEIYEEFDENDPNAPSLPRLVFGITSVRGPDWPPLTLTYKRENHE